MGKIKSELKIYKFIKWVHWELELKKIKEENK